MSVVFFYKHPGSKKWHQLQGLDVRGITTMVYYWDKKDWVVRQFVPMDKIRIKYLKDIK
jgi:hypothetical protein